MAEQKQDDQHEHTFSNYVRIRDVVQKTCLRRWTIGKSGERGSGISVLPARHDDDDDDDSRLKSKNNNSNGYNVYVCSTQGAFPKRYYNYSSYAQKIDQHRTSLFNYVWAIKKKQEIDLIFEREIIFFKRLKR